LSKINRATKVILLAIAGMLTLSITVTSAQGWMRTFNLRPIDDWITNNPWGGGPPGWGGHDYEGDWSTIYVVDRIYTFYDFIYSGFVLEEVMPDGSLKFTVWLSARNVYMEVYNSNPPPDLGIQDIVVIGTLNLFFRFQFILEPSYPGGNTYWGYVPPGVRGPGCPLPYILFIMLFPDVIGARVVFGNYIGWGSGDLMTPGSYWDPVSRMYDLPLNPTGATANVFVHQQFTVDEFGAYTYQNERVIVS